MDDLHAAIQSAIKGIRAKGKIGKSHLQPLIADRLTQLGLHVDVEDTQGFLASGQPVWRSKDDLDIVQTIGRRRIDLVVRNAGGVIALVETESDLNDLRLQGVSSRSGHYDVFSIAKGSSGQWFSSYKSLERMAAAIWYNQGGTVAGLEALQSDEPGKHNPGGIGLYLVTAKSRKMDLQILQPRLSSLNASLISAHHLG